MPPFTGWYQGSRAIDQLIANYCPATAGDQRMVPTTANGQPAFGLYMRGPDGVHRAFHIQQLEIRDGRVTHVVAYFDTSLFATFGLPEVLPALSPPFSLGIQPLALVGTSAGGSIPSENRRWSGRCAQRVELTSGRT